jgi:N-acetylneuraminic acid mutarotase
MNNLSNNFGLIFLLYSSIAFGQTGWTQKANFIGNFHWQAVGFSIGDKGYVGTGTSSPGTMHDEFWQYDTNNTWTQKASLPIALEEAVGFSIGNKGYIGTGDTASFEISTNQFFEYDTANNTWMAKASFGGTRRDHAFAFSLNGKGYIGGGDDTASTRNDLWEYDPVADTWTQKSNMPIPGITGAIAFAINGKAYVGIGFYQVYSQIFFEYDPVTDTWSQKGNFPGAGRWEAVAFSIGNYGYVGTGLFPTTNDFWQYSPANDSWLQMDSLPGTPRYDAIGFSIGNAGYLGIGANAMDFYKFSPPATIGIQEASKDNYKISLFPNPSSEFISIITDESVSDVSIMNAVCKNVRDETNFENATYLKIDFTGLVSGIYFVTIHFKNGHKRILKTLYCR